MQQASSPADNGEKSAESSLAFTPPEYTMKDIYDAIPPHCFHPNTFLSLSYVLRDFTYVAVLMGLAAQIHHIRNPYLEFSAL